MSNHLIELSDQNKNDLLQEAVGRCLAQLDKAEEILSEIRRLNPILAQDFDLKTHALEELKLRMLCYPELGKSIDHVSSYLIISYCWHKPDWPANPNGPKVAEDWEVYEPMVEKILTLRKSSDEGVWLDKLCIRQAPEFAEERRAHIGSMDVVYRSARRMLILLEDIYLTEGEHLAGTLWADMYEVMAKGVRDSNFDSDQKASFISYITQLKGLEIQHEMGLKGYKAYVETRSFVMKLLGARWFTRAWCAHEGRVIRHQKENNPLFLCFGPGNEVVTFEYRYISWLSFHCYNRVQAEIMANARPPSEDGQRGRLDDPVPAVYLERRDQLSRLQFGSKDMTSLMEHLIIVSDMGCEYKEDLVSIALNTSGIPLSFSGSLASPMDIFWVFSALSIASGDAFPLILSGGKLRAPDRPGGREIISWVEIPGNAPVGDRLQLFPKESISHVEKDYIETDLLLIQQMPVKPSTKAIAEATQLSEKHRLRALSIEIAQEDSEATRITTQNLSQFLKHLPAQRPVDAFLPTMLAFALENGLDWVRRFPDVMSDKWNDSWLYGNFRGYDERLKEVALELHSRLGGELGDEAAIKAVVCFLSCIVDNKIKFLARLPRKIQVAEDDWCITDQATNRSWIAVPAAAANLPYATDKAWLLEPFDPSVTGLEEDLEDLYKPRSIKSEDPSAPTKDHLPIPLSSDCEPARSTPDPFGARSWRLRRRQVVYGCRNLTADGVHVIHLPRQKVYGAEDYDWKRLREALERGAGKEHV